MKGDKVVIRTFGGEPRVVRVWEVADRVILICSEDNYQTLTSGKDGLWPVGIPKKDVFRYDPHQDKMLKNWQRDPHLWEHLVNYA